MVAPLRRSRRHNKDEISVMGVVQETNNEINNVNSATTTSTRLDSIQQQPEVVTVPSPASTITTITESINIDDFQARTRSRQNTLSRRKSNRVSTTDSANTDAMTESIVTASSLELEDTFRLPVELPIQIEHSLVLPVIAVSSLPAVRNTITHPVLSSPLPPTSPPLSNRTVSGSRMNNSHSSPQPTVMDYQHQTQPHQHRMHRRRSSTLSPPPPPQTRRTSLSLSSFTTTGAIPTPGVNSGGSNQNTVRDAAGATTISQDPLLNRVHQRSHPNSDTLWNVIDLPLLPMSSLHNAVQSGTETSTVLTNSLTGSSSTTSSSSLVTSQPQEDLVVPPLPELSVTSCSFSGAQSNDNAEGVSLQTAATSDLPQLQRRTSSRIAAAAAQKKRRDEANQQNDLATAQHTKRKRVKENSSDEKDIASVDEYDSGKAKAREMCCICMSFPEDVLEPMATLSTCKHEFCTHCILKWADTENSCPLCKQRFTTISIHRRQNCDNETEGRSSNKKNKTKRNSRPSTSSNQPYLKINVQVPTRNQRSEAGIVLDTILQSLTTTNGIITATSVNDPTLTFNFGFFNNPHALAARASLTNPFSTGSVRQQASNTQQPQTVMWGPPIATNALFASARGRGQVQSYHSQSTTQSPVATSTAHVNNDNPHHSGQSISNDSLYASLFSAATSDYRTLFQQNLAMNTTSTMRPSNSNVQQGDENWRRFFLRVLGGEGNIGGDSTPSTPSTSTPLSVATLHQQNPLLAPTSPLQPRNIQESSTSHILRRLLDDAASPTGRENANGNSSTLLPERQPSFFATNEVPEPSLLSRIENHRHFEQAARNTRASGQQLRQHYMDSYRDMQSRLMQHTTHSLAASMVSSNNYLTESPNHFGANGSATFTTLGQTIETAIEIPEEDDDLMVWN